MAVLTIHQYLDAVNSFITNITNSRKAYFMYFGKPTPWTDANGQINDSNVLVANASVSQHESVIYDDLTFGLRISNNNIIQMIPRYDWANNTYFDRYDQNDGNMYSKKFFVVTDNYEVYKVIDNNNGANSTVKPSLTTPYGTFNTSDGYTWKYMYSISTNANTNFTSNTYIPVTPNANVTSNAVGGTIDVIRVTAGGNNYQTYYSGYLTSTVNNHTVSIDSGASPYNDYYTGSSMYLNAGFGAGQVSKITKYDGLNKLVTVTPAFNTYAVFNLSAQTGSISVGNILTQNIDSIAYYYPQGIFQVGDTIIQTDTGANGTIITANSTVLKVVRNSGANVFSLNIPIYDTTQGGSIQSGTATVQPFQVLNITSNTGAFTVGETIYQSNGSANTANGIVFSSNSSTIYVGKSTGSWSNSYQAKGVSSSSNAVINTVSTSNNGLSYVYISTGTANTTFSVNNYIRVGSNANTNMRRITAVNTTVVTTATAFSNTLVANSYYLMPYAADILSTTLTSANAYISNTNLNGINLTYNNVATIGQSFIIGEKIDQVDINNIYQGANAIISYANSSTLILSNVNGTITPGLFVRGESSLQKASIVSQISYPNITTTAPTGTFVLGQTLTARDSSTYVSLGTANLISYYTIPNALTQYIISPTVTVTGDGSNASAYTVVNTATNSTNNIQQIVVINPGSNYSNATIAISANSNYGSGAKAAPTISPATGHGSNTYSELGASYVGITVNIANGSTQGYTFPVYGKYRKVGILEDPLYNDITVNLNNFNRVKLQLTNVSGVFSNNESVLQLGNMEMNGLNISSNTGPFTLKEIVYQSNGSANTAYGIVFSANTTQIVVNPTNGYFDTYRQLKGVTSGSNAVVNTISTVFSNQQTVGVGMVLSYTANVANSTQGTLVLYNAQGTFAANMMFANGVPSNDNIIGINSGSTANVAAQNTVYFSLISNVEIVTENTSLSTAQIVALNTNTQIALSNVEGTFTSNSYITDFLTGAQANVTSLYGSNNTINVTNIFGQYFNQTLRMPLTSNTLPFQQFEVLTQASTNAYGTIISTNNDVDIVYTGANGTFNVGDIISSQNASSNGTGIVTFANTTYLRVTAKNKSFANGDIFKNILNTGATIANVYTVLVLNNIGGPNRFQSGILSANMVGSNSGAIGLNTVNNSIVYPDLVRLSGDVIYLENFAPVTLSNTSTEVVKIVIQF